MKKKYSLGGIILKDGNSVEFKTGDWKINIHITIKKNVKIV